jgi:hypothetical protein
VVRRLSSECRGLWRLGRPPNRPPVCRSALGPLLALIDEPASVCQLITDAAASRLFFGQVLGNGLVVLLATNFVGYFFDQFMIGKSPQSGISLISRMLPIDILIKLGSFVVFTTVSYVLYAYFAEAFLGDPIVAIRTVVPTISEAIWYRNLTAVYLYSAAFGSLPIFIIAALRFLAVHPRISRAATAAIFWLQFLENKPIRLLAIVLGTFLAGFSVAAYVVLAAYRTIV